MQAAQQTLREELTRVIAELAARGRTDNFYSSLAVSFERYGSLTERQEAALRRSLAQYAERQAQREVVPTSPIPTGRVQITGTIASVKFQENRFGGSLKCLLVSDAGWKVWGTVPASIAHLDTLKGLRVTLTATVEPKEAAFGFFSRPTGASVVEAAPAPAPVVSAKLAEVAHKEMAGEERIANRLSDIIAKAKELEARKQANEARQERVSGFLTARDWDTDSMAA
jgi:hypothetical protein